MSRLRALKIVGAHGINGAVCAFLLPEFDRKLPLFDSSGLEWKIKLFSFKNSNSAVVKFENCLDRNQAEKLKGKVLYQEAELKDSEYLIDDLIGKVVSIGEDEKSRIANIVNYGAGDILELSYNDKKVLIPFRKEFFEKVSATVADSEFKISKDIFKTFFDL